MGFEGGADLRRRVTTVELLIRLVKEVGLARVLLVSREHLELQLLPLEDLLLRRYALARMLMILPSCLILQRRAHEKLFAADREFISRGLRLLVLAG